MSSSWAGAWPDCRPLASPPPGVTKWTLCDKNSWFGGKAAQHNTEGYRFDMGPTILTLPSVLKRVFDEAGRNMADYLDIVPLDPQWRCFFEGGQDSAQSNNTVLDLVPDVEQMKRNLLAFTGGEASGHGYEKFIEFSKQLHGVSDRFFFWRSVGGLKDTMEVGGAFSAAVLKDVLSLRMGQSVASVVRKHVSRASGLADDGSLHAIRWLVALRSPGGVVQHRSHANRRGHLVHRSAEPGRCP